MVARSGLWAVCLRTGMGSRHRFTSSGWSKRGEQLEVGRRRSMTMHRLRAAFSTPRCGVERLPSRDDEWRADRTKRYGPGTFTAFPARVPGPKPGLTVRRIALRWRTGQSGYARPASGLEPQISRMMTIPPPACRHLAALGRGRGAADRCFQFSGREVPRLCQVAGVLSRRKSPGRWCPTIALIRR